MGLLNPHLDDAAFAEIWADTMAGGSGASAHNEPHLRTCAECRARYSAFCGWMEALRTDAFAEADEVFTPEKLASQHAQILRRLESLDHPARVIAFPRFAAPTTRQPSGRQRWVAAAAAAGLVVGIGLGQLFDFGARPSIGSPENLGEPQQIARGQTPAQRNATGIVPAVAQTSDEAFLYDQDVVPSQVRVPESLQYLNAITPGARDIDGR